MKKLLLGNHSVARGLYEAGCRVVSSYPGTPSTEITEYISTFKDVYSEWAPNEKVAMEVAIGASIGGARAFCAMKHVGLNVAADPLFTVSYTGVNGGLVVGVADDPGMHSSQNEQDSRHYAISAKIPMLEPADSMECKEFTKVAFDMSEEFDTPVIIRLSTRVSHSQSIVAEENRQEVELKPYVKNASKYVMVPANAKHRHPVVEKRSELLREYAETSPLNKAEYLSEEIGIITSGIAYEYTKEAMPNASVLKLGMVNPLPINLIKEFAAKVKKLYVVEELDPIIENHCKVNGIDVIGKEIFPITGEFSQGLIKELIEGDKTEFAALAENIPVRPPVMCAGCPHRGLFYILSKNKVMVSGDIGCYTLGASAPLNAMDFCVCMGCSISGLHGFNKARGEDSCQNSVCVIGDSTFMHSGITGLIDIVYNKGMSTVIILDNSITGMTGHQQNPTTGYTISGDITTSVSIEKVCEAVGIKRIQIVDPADLKAVEKALKEELLQKEPSVIITRRPCALLKYVKHNPPCVISKDECKSCKACMKIGCPAISFKDNKAQIDNTLCVGCGLCSQLCAFDAIKGGQN